SSPSRSRTSRLTTTRCRSLAGARPSSTASFRWGESEWSLPCAAFAGAAARPTVSTTSASERAIVSKRIEPPGCDNGGRIPADPRTPRPKNADATWLRRGRCCPRHGGAAERARIVRALRHGSRRGPVGSERTGCDVRARVCPRRPTGDRTAALRRSRSAEVPHQRRPPARAGAHANPTVISRAGDAGHAAALRASAPERRLHLAQRLEVLVEPVDVLLHLDDARAELSDRAERAALLARLLHDVAELSPGARLPERAAQVPGAEEARHRDDSKPAADPSLEHPRPPCASHTRLRFFAM